MQHDLAASDIMMLFNTGKKPDFSKIFTGNISTPEFVLLCTCRHIIDSKKEQLYVSDLVRFFDISAQAISKHLRTCEAKGFIERSADKADRRNTLIRLTPTGFDILEKAYGEALRFQEILRTKISDEELYDLVKKLIHLKLLLSETIDEFTAEGAKNIE